MIRKIVLISLLLLGIVNATTISTNKDIYTPDDQIVTTFSDMTGERTDWIAIYPAGSEATWDNMIQWERKYAVNGNHTFEPLPVGEYEARAFFNNSFNIEASKAFSVKEGNPKEVVLTMGKEVYRENEAPVLNFENMTGERTDWIAIYAAGSEATWDNMIQWERKYAVNGSHTFKPLPAGEYEARAFFNNSFNIEGSKAFSVKEGNAKKVVLTMGKDSYRENEAPVLNFDNMTGERTDWIAIYAAGSEATWDNMIQWERKYAVKGSHTFKPLPAGEYEARAFFNNSFNIEASKAFSVKEANAKDVVLTMSKEKYRLNEAPVLNFDNMTGERTDWIAIYAAGSESTWDNIIQWERKYAVNGSHTFKPLPVGNYEARAFFNNSFNAEATKAFSVEKHEVILTSEKDIYDPKELIHISFDKFRGSDSDWIGIFPVGTDAAPENAIQWKYAKSLVSGTLNFNGLAPGNYEVKASFATLYKKTINIAVRDIAPITINYEDAENGYDQQWNIAAKDDHSEVPVIIINSGAEGSAHSIRAHLGTGSYFSFSNPDKKMRFLEFDTRVGVASHRGNFGVVVKTKDGDRRILFSSYLNHMTDGHNDFSGNAVPAEPFTSGDGYYHNHPGPTDYYLETIDGTFIHYKINIEEKLRILEPDNELLSIKTFTSAGGDFDNIKLVSH